MIESRRFEIRRDELGLSIETWREKAARKKRTVDLEIEDLTRKLVEDDGSWPRKTQRRQLALDRLLHSISYNYSIPS